MTLLEFIKSKIIGPLVTNLICMSWFRWPFEDLNDVASFQVSRAKNIRIPVQDCNNKALVRIKSSFCIFSKMTVLKRFKKQDIITFHIFTEQRSGNRLLVYETNYTNLKHTSKWQG